MRPARILLLIVAIVTGGLAAFLATRGNNPPPQQAAVAQIKEEPRTQILVASQPIGIGERLNVNVLEWQDWPLGAVRPEYVTIEAIPDAPEKLSGAVARFEFFPGEPIREAKLARTDQGYLSAVIEPGLRAVSISVSAASGAGGFIVPNDRVDVVLTPKNARKGQSETILANVKVMAIGLRLGELSQSGGVDEDDKSGGTTPKTFQKSTIATLELSPGQSETLVNAGAIGQLTLVLRSVADFADKPGDGQRSNSSIRMIRFGKEQNVQSSISNLDEIDGATQATLNPALISPELGTVLSTPTVQQAAPPLNQKPVQ